MTYNDSYRVIHLKECDSTNDYLKANYNQIKREIPVVVIADKQTAGRGRFNRTWESVEGLGIYCSFGIHLERKFPLHFLSMAVGIAVIEFLKEVTGMDFQLKWPNDILCDGKKISGVLVENSVFYEKVFSVIGIGVNVNQEISDFSDAIHSRATSVSIIDMNKDLNRLTKDLIAYIFDGINQLGENGPESLINRGNLYSKFLLNKEIMFTDQKEHPVKGVYCGINREGGAVIKLSDGTERVFFSGELIYKKGLFES